MARRKKKQSEDIQEPADATLEELDVQLDTEDAEEDLRNLPIDEAFKLSGDSLSHAWEMLDDDDS